MNQPHRFTPAEWEAYLDEALAPEAMAAMETALRSDADLLRQLAQINARRDAGLHTVGEIWRRHRLSCPTREQLESFLAGSLASEHSTYITFHLEIIGCRLCLANHADLRREREESATSTRERRSKYFQSSAGQLKKRP